MDLHNNQQTNRLRGMTIKLRLILVAIATSFSLIAMLLLGSHSIDSIEGLDSQANLSTNIKADMLLLRRHEKDFLTRKDLKYQEKFNNTLQQTVIQVDELKQNLDDYGISSNIVMKMNSQFQQYGEMFNQLVALQQQIGLHSKDGYYGTLRKAVHSAETQINALNDHQLLAGMLQLRRNEKDFMLRRDDKYVDKLTANLGKLQNQLDSSPHSTANKADLAKALNQYKTDFLKLTAIEKEMGLSHKDGLLGELRGVIHQTEELLTQADSTIHNVIAAEDERIGLIFMVVSAVFAALNITLIVWLAMGIIRPVETLSSVMAQASKERDLTQRANIKGNNEIADMAKVFNTMLGEFSNLMSQVMESSTQLSSSAEQLTAVTGKASQDVMRQRAESDMVATAINEMSSTAQEVARNANDAAAASHTADEQASKGNQVVSSAINSINELAEQVSDTAMVIKELEGESHDISTVLNVIREIAEQTNLLALNAAIEAARAGEQGRGFAVVADEVRTLAQRSQESTQEINDIINRLQEKSSSAVEAMESGLKQTASSVEQAQQAGEALSEITQAVTVINGMNIQIASAAEEQSAVAEETNRNVVNITQIANETSEGARDTSETSHALAQMAVHLRGMINQFKV